MRNARASLALSLSLVLPPAALAADDGEIAKLAWLGGCWKSENGEPGSGEHWMPLAGGTLIGVSRTVRQGKTVAFEFLQIRAGSDGKLAYFAQPSGQAPASFPLLRISDTEAVFEDLQHDFPQRIAYQLLGKTRLAARIEGTANGKLRVIEFPMSRVSCEAQSDSPPS